MTVDRSLVDASLRGTYVPCGLKPHPAPFGICRRISQSFSLAGVMSPFVARAIPTESTSFVPVGNLHVQKSVRFWIHGEKHHLVPNEPVTSNGLGWHKN